jgi:hypothetical protein
VHRTEGQIFDLGDDGSQHHENRFVYITDGQKGRNITDFSEGGAVEVVSSSSSSSSSSEEEDANQGLITDVVAKTYGHEIKLTEEKAAELGTKAQAHEHFADVYIKMSHEFENKSKEKSDISDFELAKAKTHENISSKYLAKAREVAELLEEEENTDEEHLNGLIEEYWSSAVAENNAKRAYAEARNEDSRAKGEYIKYSEMEKLAEVLLNEAKVYEDLGRVAEDNAERERKISEEKAVIGDQHLSQALRSILPKVIELRRKANTAYTSYLGYVLKAEHEQELAREDQLGAAHEIKLANACLRNAEENSVFATLEKDRSETYRAKADAVNKAMPEPATAEIVVSSKSVVRKSVEMVSDTRQP